MQIFKPQLSGQERIALLEDLAAFTRAGLPPYVALETMAAVSKKRGRRRHYSVLSSILRRLSQGRPLTEAMREKVDDTTLILIDSGERSGNLPKGLLQAATLLKRKKEMIDILRRSLTTPAINVVAFSGLVYYVSSQVVPAAKKLMPPQYLSDLSKAYFAFGDAYIAWGPYIALIAVAVCVIILVSMPRFTGGIRKILDERVFPWTLYRYMQSSAFLLTCSSMLKAGIPFGEVVSSFKTDAKWMRSKIVAMKAFLASGLTETEAIHRSGILPPDIDDRLSVYAKLPDFVSVMESLSQDAIERAKAKLTAFATTVSTTTMILIAAFIIFTLFGIGDAAMSVSDAASRRSGSM